MNFYKIRSIEKSKILIVIIFTIIINYMSLNAYPIVNHFDKNLLQSPWTENIIVNTTSASYIYGVYVFIISAIMYADTIVLDEQTGLKNVISTKISWKKYVIKTLIFNFVLAGLISTIPLIFNILSWFLLRPNVPINYINAMNIFNDELFAGLFFKSKVFFYVLHLIKIFIIGGIIATLAITINTKYNNRYIGICIGLIIDSLLQVIFSIFGNPLLVTSILDMIVNIYKPDLLTFINIIIFISISIRFFIIYVNQKDII